MPPATKRSLRARASLARIQALRAERPGDGVLAYYQSLVHASIGVRDAAVADSVMTGGIDGLYWHRGNLVGVQNSTNPGRVIRIALADGGTRIAGVTVLQSHHHPLFVEPTTGTIVGGKLHVIANSHVLNHQPDGTLRDVASLRPTAIVAVPLGS